MRAISVYLTTHKSARRLYFSLSLSVSRVRTFLFFPFENSDLSNAHRLHRYISIYHLCIYKHITNIMPVNKILLFTSAYDLITLRLAYCLSGPIIHTDTLKHIWKAAYNLKKKTKQKCSKINKPQTPRNLNLRIVWCALQHTNRTTLFSIRISNKLEMQSCLFAGFFFLRFFKLLRLKCGTPSLINHLLHT